MSASPNASDQVSAHAYVTTPRLRLTPVSAGDPAEVADLIGNYDVARWLGRVPYPYSRADAEAFIAANADQTGRVWFIHDKGGLVGGISIDDELGYWLARPAWGKGYATEAGDWVVDVHFADPEAGALPSNYFPGNCRSAGVLKKLGFQETGQRPVRSLSLGQTIESHGMALARDAWRSRREIRIDTPRLTLRPLTAADAPILARIGGVPEIARMMTHLTAPWREPDVLNWIATGRFRGRPGYRLAITRDGRLIGTVGFGPDQSISYLLDRESWGKGIVTEAMTGFIADTFDRFPGITQLKADHFTDNPASGAVLRKLGFRETGTAMLSSRARSAPEPCVLYRLTRNAWAARP